MGRSRSGRPLREAEKQRCAFIGERPETTGHADGISDDRRCKRSVLRELHSRINDHGAIDIVGALDRASALDQVAIDNTDATLRLFRVKNLHRPGLSGISDRSCQKDSSVWQILHGMKGFITRADYLGENDGRC